MPPRQKPKTPTIPSPAGRELRRTSIPLKQAKFPSPNKRVRTYGTKAPKRIPKLQAQDTLTQLWPQDGFGDENAVEGESLDGDEIEDEDEITVLEEPRPVRSATRSAKRRSVITFVEEEEEDEYLEGSEKQRKKRRKTTGDELDVYKDEMKKSKKGRRRTLGDTPLSESQQTLTQMVPSPMVSFDDDEEDQVVDLSIYEVPNSSQYQPPLPRRRPAADTDLMESQRKKSTADMPPPQTPHRRRLPREIPSSQSPAFGWEIPSSQSPATPCSIHSRSGRPPLGEKPTNAPIPFNKNTKSILTHPPSKPPRLVVRDTFDSYDESQATRIPSTPSKKSSPPKSVRFNLPDDSAEDSDAENEDDEDDDSSPIMFPGLARKATANEAGSIEMGTKGIKAASVSTRDLSNTKDDPPLTQLSKQTRRFKDKVEIIDSDEESDMSSESESETELDIVTTATSTKPENDVEETPDLQLNNSAESDPLPREHGEGVAGEIGPDTCYDGNFGLETQVEVEQVVSSVECSRQADVPVHVTTLSSQVVEPTIHSDVPPKTKYHAEETQVREGRSQFVSQRLSTQHVDDMAPRTADSDAFISIHPSQIRLIKNRSKTHIMKKWPLPPMTVRTWFYETDPKSRIKYMVTIGVAKRPGDKLDEGGIGNTSFNAKPPGTIEYAYEIFDLYELADPVPLDDIKEKGWFKAAPSKFIHVRPVPLDELMANLLPPIFTRYGAEDESEDELLEEPPVSSATDTQEVVSQLAATIKQFTQPHAEFNSDPPVPETLDEEDRDDEPQVAPIQAPIPQHPRLSQAETVDLTQTQLETPIHQSPEIVWESPTRPVRSSTPQLPSPRVQESPTRRVPTSTPRLPSSRIQEYQSSEISDAGRGSDSVVPFLIPSSQFLTKSQMLPDSLINNSIPGPTMFVADSDDEIEDDDIEDDEDDEL